MKKKVLFISPNEESIIVLVSILKNYEIVWAANEAEIGSKLGDKFDCELIIVEFDGWLIDSKEKFINYLNDRYRRVPKLYINCDSTLIGNRCLVNGNKIDFLERRIIEKEEIKDKVVKILG
jgi:hypothetical protein